MEFVRSDDFGPIWTKEHRELIGDHVVCYKARLAGDLD